MTQRQRQRRYREKKPTSTVSLVYGGIGCASILIFLVMVLVGASLSSGVPNWLSGISVLVMIASVVVLILAWKTYTNDNFSKASRIFGLASSAVAVFLWLILYLIGILVG